MMIMRSSYVALMTPLLLGAGYAVVAALHARTAPITFFVIDPRLAEQEQQHMVTVLEQEQFQRPATVATVLKKKFPEIASVSVAYAAALDQEIEVRSVNPLVRVNAATILCDQGPLLSDMLFQKKELEQLPRITVHTEEQEEVRSLRTFVQKIPTAIYDRFAIHWYGNTKIVFTDKEKSDLCIVADAQKIPSEKNYLAQCDTVYAAMKERQKKNDPIMIDLRFEKQIITYFKSAEGV